MAKAKEKKTADKKAVKKVEDKELVQNSSVDLEGDAGVGQENMGVDDYAVPRLYILQQLSPQLNKTQSEYMPEAELGQILDTVSLDLFDGDEGITVVPVSWRRAYIEWRLRSDNGGGFVADHGTDDTLYSQCKPDSDGRMITPNGTQIVPTAEYFVFIIDKESGMHSPAVISMAGSQLKKSRQWNMNMSKYRLPSKNGGTFNPAIFARSYQMTTVPESNDKGSWFGWKIVGSDPTLELPNGSEIYLEAKKFKDMIDNGEVQAAKHQDVGGASSSDESDDDPM